jgi:hypothetical protein
MHSDQRTHTQHKQREIDGDRAKSLTTSDYLQDKQPVLIGRRSSQEYL